MSNDARAGKPDQLRRIPGGIARESYFPTHIYFGDLEDTDTLNPDVEESIRRLKAETPAGIQRSNVSATGAWHSGTDLHRRSEFCDLVEQFFSAAEVVFEDEGYDPDYEPAIDLMWANISPRYAFNRHHSHPGVLWSAAYYVKTPPKCGRIFFSDPRLQAHVIEPHYPEGEERGKDAWSEVYYEALEGRILIFPAWLCHEVEPNLAKGEGPECERISISFNVFQREKDRPTALDQGPIVRSDLARLRHAGRER
jgi:uncharacterized protein (TIGR02466 family)